MVRGVVDARTARADKVQVDAFPAAEPPFEASVHVSSNDQNGNGTRKNDIK